MEISIESAVDLGRRRLLLGAAAGVASGLAARILPAWAEPVPITLLAGRRTLDVNGRAASVFGITQSDGTQGLITDMGKPFQVLLRNESGADTLVHWHGLKPPYQQDGVPQISAPPIPSGATAQYDFPLDFGGTYWMHAHQGMQEQLLMTAPLIIREPGDLKDRQEVVLILNDFSFRSPQEILADLRRETPQPAGMGGMAGMKGNGMSGMAAMPGMAKAGTTAMPGMKAMDLNDVKYDAFLANDRTIGDPQVIRVERGGRILLRIINGASSSNFRDRSRTGPGHAGSR